VNYDKVDDQGLHITITKGEQSEQRVLDVDNIVVCAGQESVNGLFEALKENTAFRTHLVGGAEFAGELDAKRAIRKASELAASL
jgi:2,4-dienoyl-CoA reductase (NADPH2)